MQNIEWGLQGDLWANRTSVSSTSQCCAQVLETWKPLARKPTAVGRTPPDGLSMADHQRDKP